MCNLLFNLYTVEEKRVLFMLDAINSQYGTPHTVSRDTLYEDTIKLYKDRFQVLKFEYPFRIAYQNEQAIDTGGVARDMFSAFWELVYVQDMDGGSTYVPMMHPHTDLSHYNILGSIIAHGFMSTGFLPIRMSYPAIAFTLLGCDVEFPDSIIIDSFIDFTSTYESSIFQEALKASKRPGANFSTQLLESLMSILGGMGCRKIPTPCNIKQLIAEVARYVLTVKPLGAMYSLCAGVPVEYHTFWNDFSVKTLYELYKALNATPESIINVLTVPDDIDSNQSRMISYLKTFIGNLTHQDLRNFLRFITGSSVMIDKKISITFNQLSGLSRRPITHTCNCILELPVTYLSYPDFADEFLTVLRSEVAWPMDSL